MTNQTTWPNHARTVTIFTIIGAGALIVALGIFFIVLLPTLKKSIEIIDQQAVAESAQVFPDNTKREPAVTIPKTVAEQISVAKELDRRARYVELIPVAESIIKSAKTDTDKALGYYFLAHAQAVQKEYAKAKESANTALSLDPKLADGYNVLAYVAGEEFENEKSLEYAQKAIALDPNNAWAHNLLGIAYSYKGWLALSISEFEDAVRLNPNNNNYKDNLRSAKAQQQGIAN